MSRPSSQRQYTRIASTLGSLVTVLLLQACGGGGVERASICDPAKYVYQAPACDLQGTGCTYGSSTLDTSALTGADQISADDPVGSLSVTDANLFVSQPTTNSIKLLSKITGINSAIISTPDANPANRSVPVSTAYVACLGLFYSDSNQKSLKFLDTNTNTIKTIRSNLKNPGPVAADKIGNTYLVDRGDKSVSTDPGTIYKIDPTGKVVTTVLSSTTLRNATSIAYTSVPQARLYLAINRTVQYIDPTSASPSLTTYPKTASNGIPATPNAIATDGLGYLYMLHNQGQVAIAGVQPQPLDPDYGGHGVSRVNPYTLSETRIAGKLPMVTLNTPPAPPSYTSNTGATDDDKDATKATFEFPSALTVDGSGNVFILDRKNQKIRVLTPIN